MKEEVIPLPSIINKSPLQTTLEARENKMVGQSHKNHILKFFSSSASNLPRIWRKNLSGIRLGLRYFS